MFDQANGNNGGLWVLLSRSKCSPFWFSDWMACFIIHIHMPFVSPCLIHSFQSHTNAIWFKKICSSCIPKNKIINNRHTWDLQGYPTAVQSEDILRISEEITFSKSVQSETRRRMVRESKWTNYSGVSKKTQCKIMSCGFSKKVIAGYNTKKCSSWFSESWNRRRNIETLVPIQNHSKNEKLQGRGCIKETRWLEETEGRKQKSEKM